MSQEARRHARTFLRGISSATPTEETKQLWKQIAQQVFRLANTKPQVNEALGELRQWLDRQERRVARTRAGGAPDYRDVLAGIIYLKASSLLAADARLRRRMLRDPSVTSAELQEPLRRVEAEFGEALLDEVKERMGRAPALSRRVRAAAQQARELGRELQEMSELPPVLRGRGGPQAAVPIVIFVIIAIVIIDHKL